ncbi:serine/threonine-protein kinase AFC2 isoform X1 [Tanacetum coccineum]
MMWVTETMKVNEIDKEIKLMAKGEDGSSHGKSSSKGGHSKHKSKKPHGVALGLGFHFTDLKSILSSSSYPLYSIDRSIILPMETERVTEFPMSQLDLRPRKRQRLGWDVVATPPKAQLGLFCGQEIGNLQSFTPSSRAPSDNINSNILKRVARNLSPPWRQDDKDGHYVFAVGDNLTSRYKIHGKMGEGTFGQVLECWDKERKEMVAIKVVRGIKKYREAAMIEVDMLQQLGKHDKGGNRCVQIRNWFDYRNHICIVFEKLGPSLYDFLRKNNYRSFPIDLVREIGRQLLEFMHDLRLIHTDLKPENILLVSPEYVKVPDYKGSSRSPKDSSFSKRVPKSSAIKVIDFGSTTYDRQDQSYIVSTRHYRAPEVILGHGWSYPCDIWSVGCILVELCSGEALFQTHENLEHLAMMERVLGPLPSHMLKKADRHAEKYVRKGRLDWPEGAASRESIKAVLKLPRLQNLIMQHVDHSAGDLIHLLQGLLRYDPSERLSARAALRHPFFTRDHLRRY